MVGGNIAIVGESLSAECLDALHGMGYETVILPRDCRFGAGVSTHTDLMVFPLGDILFTYGGTAGNILRSKGFRVTEICEIPESEYPYHVYLNALLVGRYIFARKKYLAEAVLAEALRRGYTVVDVRQGYARCGACPISDGAIITSDPSISRAAFSVGIDVLSVSVGGVDLKGYPYGFIGGACGVDGDRVFFAGDIYTHPDGERIVTFCRKHGKEVISLSGGVLNDVGSIFFAKV